MIKHAIVATALLIAFAARGQELSADQIIARHIDARGGYEKIKAIQTLVYSNGTYRERDFTGSGKAFMAFKRPWYRVVGNPEDRTVSIMEGYDGSSWEYYADPGVALRTVGNASSATRRGAYLDGPLVDYREKGSTVVRAEDETIDGKPAYHLVVTYADGFISELMIDKQSFLIVAGRYHAPFHAYGEKVKTETRPSDYRRVAGVLFSFAEREVDIATGTMLTEMQWGKIEANRELPPYWFSPPAFARSRVQTLIDHLYLARTDPKAVMWSYEQFRRTYPDADTRAAVEFIGYQFLKMGSVDSAVALLTANLRDHPDAASAKKSLDRALKAVEDSKH